MGHKQLHFMDLAGFRSFFELLLQDELRGKKQPVTEICLNKASCIHDVLKDWKRESEAERIVKEICADYEKQLRVWGDADMAANVKTTADLLFDKVRRIGRQDCHAG